MTITFVSDIHLNLRKNKEWELNRFNLLKEEIKKQSSDWLVLGGDIFDKANPNLDEIYAFYQFVGELKDYFKNIIVISGNHEDLSQRETCFHKLPKLGFSYIEFTQEPLFVDNKSSWAFYFVSHHKIQSIKDINLTDKNNILFSHIRGNLGIVKAEYSLNKISKMFDYTILGDIHIPYKPYDNVEYCGSPYTIQYEIPRDTGFFKLNFSKNKLDVEFIKTNHLPQKIKYDLSIKEYKELLPFLDKNNLYKIVLHDKVTDLSDLEIPDNVSIVFNSIIDEEEIENEVAEIKKVGNIDVIDTLLKLVKNSENIDDESYNKGLKLIDEFKREYYE